MHHKYPSDIDSIDSVEKVHSSELDQGEENETLYQDYFSYDLSRTQFQENENQLLLNPKEIFLHRKHETLKDGRK